MHGEAIYSVKLLRAYLCLRCEFRIFCLPVELFESRDASSKVLGDLLVEGIVYVKRYIDLKVVLRWRQRADAESFSCKANSVTLGTT